MDQKGLGRCCCCFFVLVVITGITFAVFESFKKHTGPEEQEDAPINRAMYVDALKIAMQFFDVQKSGKLENNEIEWRGDSGLKDGSEAKIDLSKGLYDAGDLMKFGFPMAFTATVLSWAILENGDEMKMVDQLDAATNSLKWITDFLINAHPSHDLLYIQVGDPEVDHSCWSRPEDWTGVRPLTQVNTTAPGTEVAAETAAALASASLVFKATDSTYSSLLLKHAQQLFEFGDKYRGLYSSSIPQVATYYNSTGYGDELLWAAAWLYHATGNQSYLEYVTGENGEEFADWGNPTWFSWDNKLPGAQVLLSRVSFFGSNEIATSQSEILKKYKDSATTVICGLLPKSPTATSSRTHNGLIWVSEWNALQHPVASAFIAALFSEYMLASRTSTISCQGQFFTPSNIRHFAISQVDYVLGKNPMEMSYLVGYGDKYPQYVHHRGASIPADEKPACKEGFKWLDSTRPNPNTAMGALVGGPFLNETYVDSRNNSMQGEPTTYNTALIVGLLSTLLSNSAKPNFT